MTTPPPNLRTSPRKKPEPGPPACFHMRHTDCDVLAAKVTAAMQEGWSLRGGITRYGPLYHATLVREKK